MAPPMTEDARLWAGVDLGTQSAKVQVVDAVGIVRTESVEPLTSRRELGRHEQDPHSWTGAVRTALARALGPLDPAERRRIQAIATCSTSGTLAVLDDSGRPVGPGIMYDDARAADLVDEVVASAPERWDRLGYRIQPSWALPKIVALTRAGLPPASRIVHQTDVVSTAMTGGMVATDWSSALKSGYDLLDLAWPVDAFERLGVDTTRLPPVVAPGSVLGRTTAAWEQDTGLPEGTAVVAGMTDGCAAQLGAGALAPGDWHSVLGTTLVLKGVTPEIVYDQGGAVYSHRAPHDDLWLPGGASSIGAGALSALLESADLAAVGDEAGRLWATGRTMPTVTYPLTGTGERFPMVRPDARGFVVVDDSVRELDELRSFPAPTILLSVFAGVAAVERLCFEALAGRGARLTGRLSSSGGGTRSRLWTQIRADMLDHPIAVPESAEASLGMAVLAAWSTTPDASLVDVAATMTRISEVIEPDRTGVDRMSTYYAAFSNALKTRDLLPA